MVDSCCCLTENKEILKSNYPSIKKINKLKKKKALALDTSPLQILSKPFLHFRINLIILLIFINISDYKQPRSPSHSSVSPF